MIHWFWIWSWSSTHQWHEISRNSEIVTSNITSCSLLDSRCRPCLCFHGCWYKLLSKLHYMIIVWIGGNSVGRIQGETDACLVHALISSWFFSVRNIMWVLELVSIDRRYGYVRICRWLIYTPIFQFSQPPMTLKLLAILTILVFTETETLTRFYYQKWTITLCFTAFISNYDYFAIDQEVPSYPGFSFSRWWYLPEGVERTVFFDRDYLKIWWVLNEFE